MRNLSAIHEGFMNGSRTILPRVGGGVGEGCGVGVMAKFSTHLQSVPATPATAPTAPRLSTPSHTTRAAASNNTRGWGQ